MRGTALVWLVVAAVSSVWPGTGCFTVCQAQDAGQATGAGSQNASAEHLMTRGKQSLERGALDRAIEEWGAAARLFAAAQEVHGEIRALANMAAAYQELGRHKLALESLEKALALAEASGNSSDLLLAKSSLGTVCTYTRQHQRAESLLRESLQGAEAANAGALVAVIQHDLGNLMGAQGRWMEAEQAYGGCLKLAHAEGNAGLVAKARANLAALHVDAGRPETAEKLNDDAVRAAAQLPPSHLKAQLLLKAGTTYSEIRCLLEERDADSRKRMLVAAADAFTQGLQVAEQIADSRARSLALGYLGEQYEVEGRHDEALELTRRALFIAQEIQSPHLLYRWEWAIGRVLARQGEVDQAIGVYRQAADALRIIQQDCALGSGHADTQRSFRDTVGRLYFELADLLLRQADGLADPAAVQRNLIEARDTVELLKAAELKDYFQDDCVSIGQTKVTNLEGVLKDAAAVYYIPLPERTEILLSLPTKLERFTSRVGANELTAQVKRFRWYLQRPGSGEAYKEYSSALYDALIRPLETTLAANHVHTLILVPDGALRTIPFGALHDGKQFLIEKFAVAATPGLTLMDAQPIARQHLKVLAGGLSEAVQGFEALANVPAELQNVLKHFPGKELLNQQFRKVEVTREFSEGDYAVVHLASHGEFNSDVKRTFVLTYDGKLTLDALEELIRPRQFRGTAVQLLVLSACQTATGDERAALGLAGVAIKAGARSALATLWSVSDESTARLIAEFYRELAQDPSLSKAAVLQRAQTSLLRDEQFSHPAFWAPYLLIGNWL